MARSPLSGERVFCANKTIDELEADAFTDWPDFIKKATQTVRSEQDKALLSNNQTHIPFAKAFTPFAGLFYDEISPYLKDKPFKLSSAAMENLITGLLQDYVEACALTLYCTIEDEIPDRNHADYDAWLENFCAHRWPDFTAEYSVLGILLKQRYDQYVHHCREVFDRFEKDILLIQKTFKTTAQSISNLEFRLSDRHNHGRSVCKFTLNGSVTIIYKPKSLKNEAWMQNLLKNNPGFKTSGIGQYTILDMGDYGWSEFIQADKEIKHSTNDVIESYSSLLAFLYLLNASDMHTENAMVCNNKFYPIDLETIFNPSIAVPEHNFSWRDYSIFFTGMLFNDLDMHLAGPDSKKHYYNNKMMHPMYKVVVDEKSGVSLHMYEAAEENKEGGTYRPSNLSKEEWMSFAQKTEEKILNYRNHLLEDDSLKNETLPCRHVPRNTAFYARIQQVLYHPHKLKDFKDWENYIGELIETLDSDQKINIENQAALIDSEMSQLKRGDIPYFTYNTASKNLHADNAIIAENFFQNTGAATIQEKLTDLTEIDAAEIKTLLIAKYITWNQEPTENRNAYSEETQKNPSVLPNDRILQIVKNITETILSSANINEGQPARFLSHEGDVTGLQAYHVAGNPCFYNGYWGIIAFLLAAEKNLPSHEAAPIKDFVTREMQIWLSSKQQKPFSPCAGFGGLAGYIKALSIINAIRPNSVAATLWKKHGCKDEIFKALDKKFDAKEFTDFDYMAGKLGLFSILHEVPDAFIDKDALQPYLNTYHNDLLTHWDNYISHRDKALIGFAHGISALVDHLAHCLNTHQKADKTSINALLSKVWDYDRACKIAKSGESLVWSDNRYLDIRPVNRSWCHGLPGIGLSRLSLLNVDSYKNNALDDLSLILQTLAHESKTSGSHHLCCGDCGEIDFLIEISKTESLHSISEKLLDLRIPALLNHIGNGQHFCGMAGTVESSMAPDLFQGAAGIGYTLLRLHDSTLPMPY